MLDFFRAITKSRIGAVIGLVFLGLIVLAFAGADVGGMRTGSLIGGENAASVGASRITTGELDKTVRSAFDNERQRTPTLTMKDFLAQGVLDEVLTGLIDRAATWEWGAKNGFGISDRLIDSEIAKLPAFQGPDGKFSQSAYNQLLAQRGLTDKLVRDDIAKGLLSHQAFAGATEGALMPIGVGQTYIALLKEKRTGAMAILPSEAFAPKTPPTDAQVADFYKANVARYNRPERRTIRYAVIDDSALKTLPDPTPADIAKNYQANAATYAPGETRSVTQVILPTQDAARAFAAEIASGKTIDAAAGAKGLVPAKLADKSRDQLATETSKAVADAVFAAAQGATIAPAKGALGWVVAHVDAVRKNPGKTLDQARAEIAVALKAEKHKAALTDLATHIGELVEAGTSLADVAKTYGLTVTTTDALQADGTVPGKPDAKPSPDVQPLLQTAFSMDHEGQPQIAALPGTLRAAVYDVGTITPAAPAALAEIKAVVAADWTRQQGSDAAAAAADKVLAALGKKMSLDAAIKSLGLALPPIKPIEATREQLSAMKPRPPAPLVMMFSMSAGTAKKVAGPNQAGWLVVSLATITAGTVPADDPSLALAAGDLGKATGREYEAQLRTAITREIGSKRNEAAIRTVRGNLTGAQ
ncbi:SurA N-terminal domain-containing protein [Novosphingobium sp.]|uniref:peptidylprolyl isomerase n=1 Tax=Novosphingobium sp. TaxID=1874826 RepID=UPI003340C397